ncbi:MAG: protein-arginine deiminase family protein [Capsulimonadales bacterium]|nr:protein-arginine deiminase family protein [Capsulimonadales bacterium]
MPTAASLILPLIGSPETYRPDRPHLKTEGAVSVHPEGPDGWKARLHLYVRRESTWVRRENLGAIERGGDLALAATPARPGDRAAQTLTGTLRLRSQAGETLYEARIAPVLLASSLDPVREVWVVRNALTERFAREIARLAPRCKGRPRVRFVRNDVRPEDVWMQDTVEFGTVATPEADGKARQRTAALLGLRAKHDMGLTCGPLDSLVRKVLERDRADIVPLAIGEPRAGARWIDWYGNLEVTPPVRNHPFGRILTGQQRGLTLHPDLLAFLEAQKYQWPPLYLDVGWLTIGHVDELIQFVPAPGPPGFRVLMPSPRLAVELLEGLVRQGHGNRKVFSGRKGETTVTQLLDEAGRTTETDAIEKALAETRRQLRTELGIDERQIVSLPVLFRNGLAVIPNGVNGLVLGSDYLVPAPNGPVIEGVDVLERAIRDRLQPLGLRLRFLDIYEPYHVRAGEIHCGTNTVRIRKKVDWWTG